MTRQQVNLISNMIRSQTTAAFHEARKELLASCEEQKSDAVAPQPSVTVTATASQSEPVPPSTPKPLGSGWWKDRQTEALQEQIVIIADQRETIVELKKRIEYGEKHNTELVAANAEIHESLRHYGLDQPGPCSFVGNVKQVICLCDKRGEEIEQMADTIAKLRHEKSSDEASYISKLTDRAIRIGILKEAGNNLNACLKRYLYSDTQQPQVVIALRDWEKEAIK